MSAKVIAVSVLLAVTAAACLAIAADDFTPIAGKWAGNMVWPDGSSDMTEWTIAPDGRYSVQAGAYTLRGQLKQMRGNQYGFKLERSAQVIEGTMELQQKDGQKRLTGNGRDPNGPVNFTLTRL